MGSLGFLLRRRTRKMKLSLVVVAVILAVLISSCEAQKGGAKSAMRNRGRGGSSRAGGGRRGNSYSDNNRGPDDKFGNGTGRRAVSDCASSENFEENRHWQRQQRGNLVSD